MIVNRIEFLEKLKIVFPFTDSKSSMQNCGHECFLFQDGWLSAFNNYTSISVKLPDSFDIDYMVVDAKILKQLFEKMTRDEVSLFYSDYELKIKCGKMNSRIKCIEFENSDFDYNIDRAVSSIHKKIKSIDWKELPGNFFEGVVFCNIPNNRNVLAGICVKDDCVYDYAGYACSWFKMEQKMDEMFLPDDKIKILSKIGGIKKYISNDVWVHFAKEEEGLLLSIRQIKDYNFPFDGFKEIKKESVKENSKFSGIIPSSFIEVLERAVLFCKEYNNVMIVKLNFDDSGITISAKKDKMEFNEFIEWEEKVKAFEPFECFVNVDNLFFGLREKLIFSVWDKEDQGIVSFSDQKSKLFMFSLSKSTFWGK